MAIGGTTSSNKPQLPTDVNRRTFKPYTTGGPSSRRNIDCVPSIGASLACEYEHFDRLVHLVLLHRSTINARQREFSLSAAPSDMKVDGDGRVFLAAGNQLFRLDSTLALQENVTLGSSVLRVALSSDERRVVVCLSDMSCAVYNASDFGAGEQSRRTGASVSSDVIALFTADENSFYVGSVSGGPSPFMNLGQYGFVESFARSTNYRIQRSAFMRTFFGGFVNGTNAYYFMTDGAPRNVRGLRVL